MTTQTTASLLLNAQHRLLLVDGSAIAPPLVQQRGYQSLPQPADLIDRRFSKAQAKAAPALGIPLWNVHGQQDGWQIRPDCPRQLPSGKVFKYEMPKGDRLILDVHPSVQPLLGDPHEPLWITEGVRKGDSLASHGLCTIALVGGVWGFRGTNAHGGKVILPDWDYVALNNREVMVVFDSDIYRKPQVDRALKALNRMLRDRAARPALVEWPEAYRQQKWGVDDFFAQGHTLDELRAMLPPLGPLPQTPPAARRNGQTPGGGASKPIIYLDTNLERWTNEGTAALLRLTTASGAPLVYQRARRLALIASGVTPPRWLHRPPDAPIIVEASEAALYELASMAACWQHWDGRAEEWTTVLPPRLFVPTLVGRPFAPFPALEGILHAPTLRPDGSLLDQPGYDPSTGLYLDPNGTTFPPLPDTPDIFDAQTAIGHLQEAFIDFPFAEPWHFSAALAAVLSLACRFAVMGNVPLFAIRANTRGSGKSLLADVISLIGTGRAAPRWPQVAEPDEERKRLLTVALAGYPCLHIDNVVLPLGSPALDMALTAPSFSDRILGKHESREAPLSMVWLASGNNMQFRGDTARRVVPIDLDPRMERPEERTNFTHTPLLPWVQQQRPRLTIAALTLVKAFFEAGCPAQGITPMGSFEAWSDLVRQALIWAGEADPNEGRKAIEAESDPEYEQLAALLTAWEACYAVQADGASPAKTINQVKQDIALYAATQGAVPTTWDALREALIPFDRRYDGTSLHTHRIGNALRTIEGRVIGTTRLRRRGEYRHNALWRIERV